MQAQAQAEVVAARLEESRALIDQAIDHAKEAYREANDVNRKLGAGRAGEWCDASWRCGEGRVRGLDRLPGWRRRMELIARSLDAVFGFGGGDGLPLHVARLVGSSALERDHVVDHIAGAGSGGMAVGGAWVFAPERMASCRAAGGLWRLARAALGVGR